MKQLLECGVHFGHQTRRWNPKMKPYIFTERNGVYIIDLQKTVRGLDRAYDFIRTTVSEGGTVLFVGTKRQAQDTIREGCATVAAYEMQAEALAAATGSCKARNAVEKVRVTITGICNNTAQITDAQAGNYVKTIGASVKQAQSAVAAGC